MTALEMLDLTTLEILDLTAFGGQLMSTDADETTHALKIFYKVRLVEPSQCFEGAQYRAMQLKATTSRSFSSKCRVSCKDWTHFFDFFVVLLCNNLGADSALNVFDQLVDCPVFG